MKTLREWRLARLKSLAAVERESGVTKKTLIDLEHGRRRPHYDTMAAICRVLEVEPGEVAEFAAALEERSKDAA